MYPVRIVNIGTKVSWITYQALYPISDVAITLLAKERKMHADPKRSNESI